MRIVIGIPHKGDIKVKTMLSIMGNVADLDDHCMKPVKSNLDAFDDVIISEKKSAFVHYNRDEIFGEAVNLEADYLCFVDTDMVFSFDAIRRLIERKKAIIGVDYRKKLPIPASTVWMKPSDCLAIRSGNREAFTEPFKCQSVGTGLMLLDVAAIKQLLKPLFKADYPVGEDVYFCTQARKAGLEVWCDPTINVKHIGDYEY